MNEQNVADLEVPVSRSNFAGVRLGMRHCEAADSKVKPGMKIKYVETDANGSRTGPFAVLQVDRVIPNLSPDKSLCFGSIIAVGGYEL